MTSMFKMFRKSFWVPYEDSSEYPTVTKAKAAIAQYCAENGWQYEFVDDKVVINGETYSIYRGYQGGSRGNYGISCTKVN